MMKFNAHAKTRIATNAGVIGMIFMTTPIKKWIRMVVLVSAGVISMTVGRMNNDPLS